MALKRGFVRDLVARDDGWVEVVLLAVHSTSAPSTCLIRSLDGDLTQAHRRLAQLGLLRDALARTLPVELATEIDDKQGEIIVDVTIHPTDGIDGRRGTTWVTGVVIGLGARERGPESDVTPYLDAADEASVVVLLDSGSIVELTLDLQRPHPGTGQAMLALIAESRRTRRALRLHLAGGRAPKGDFAATSTAPGSIVVGCAWPTLDTAELSEVVAFVERMAQRTESWDAGDAGTVNRIRVDWRTAPEQHPAGDVSEDGGFTPTSGSGWIHADSPLVARLVTALREGLQVRLGCLEDAIHAVELSCPLGSAARPVWVSFGAEPVCEPDPQAGACVAEPTVKAPSVALLDAVPRSVRWCGSGWFKQGIWRFAITSGSPVSLTIDGDAPCVDPTSPGGFRVHGDSAGAGFVAHAYLDGLHNVELVVRDRTCSTPFEASIYRIR